MKTRFTNNSVIKSVFLFLGIIIGAIVIMLSFSGCTDTCTNTITYITYKPVYASMSTLRTQVEVLPPQPREGQGKIYVYGDYLLLGDPGLGIHVYNNADKANPMALGFINIPGNYDMAVRGGLLYADSYVDLLVFNINDPGNISLVNRLEDVFPLYNTQFGVWAEGDQVVTKLEELEVVEVNQECTASSPDIFFMREDVLALQADAGGLNSNLGAAPLIGVGGSMARFTIVGSYLYAVDDYMMHIFDLLAPENPVDVNDLDLGWGIETIYPFKNNLFIGSRWGMSVYNIDNPATPAYMSEVQHITTCDPVVANDDYAFVTLRSENEGNPCGTAFVNQLDVIDISDITNATLLYTYNMTSPYGLGLDGNILFVAEGDAGLKVFDVSDVSRIDQNLISHVEGFNAYDVIPYQGVLILTGNDGLYQFDYTDLNNIRMLSLIPAAN